MSSETPEPPGSDLLVSGESPAVPSPSAPRTTALQQPPTLGRDSGLVKMATFSEDAFVEAEARRLREVIAASNPQSEEDYSKTLLRNMLNISPQLSDGAASMVDDSFLRCFTTNTHEPWNHEWYLWPFWAMGVVFRHLILLPLRLCVLVLSILTLVIVLFTVSAILKNSPKKKHVERKLVQILPNLFLMSWSAVIRYHGPLPTQKAGRLHSGWIRFLQTRVLSSLGCLWFDRTDMKDRSIGTCVNNESTVLFKRGAFDMPGVTVCPIAIKYNSIFVDAFHNSKKEPFGQYIMKLMSSWAIVADVWFLEPQQSPVGNRGRRVVPRAPWAIMADVWSLEPQQRRDGESVDDFASRVQKMIAGRAKLKVVKWDGYLKYYNLGEKNPGLIEKRRKVFADRLLENWPAEHTPGKEEVVRSPKKEL
eukprot:gene11855-14960_t